MIKLRSIFDIPLVQEKDSSYAIFGLFCRFYFGGEYHEWVKYNRTSHGLSDQVGYLAWGIANAGKLV